MSTEPQRIVLIEDDPDMHDAVKMVLEPLGYQVTCHLTGPSGLDALRADGADLILLDIMLSTPIEGIELCRELKRDAALKQIPIILISAIGQTMGIEVATESGSGVVPAEVLLEKPFEAQTLRDAVRQILAGT